MRHAFRSAGRSAYLAAERTNIDNIRRALQGRTGGRVLDLGCGDGRTTVALCASIHATSIRGVERHLETAEAARRLGIDVVDADLDEVLPFEDASFDVVISNQVIEHLSDTDTFVEQIHRVLVPGGDAVVSTENLASWHNIVALVLGFAPFSTINYSDRIYPLGNPLSIHGGESLMLHDGMVHRRIFTTTSLRALFSGHGFHVRGIHGSGYYPLPAAVGRIDPRHAHFITIAATKPLR
jgi:methionine biosynthesis protein MetW